ncbi:DsbA family protein [Microbacterium sp. NPDC077663]|uniref:DsbA family protein n=1 Tax=Microbacterium sp. NPDC077663 TaxID=3364189 RepID=UPI0037C9D352
MAGGTAFGKASAPVQVDVWSDIACPFCYMGTTALSQAIARSEHPDRVQVTYHSFELVPQLTGRFEGSIDEFLAEEQRVPITQAKAMNQQLAERFATLGLEYRHEVMVVAGTRSAHRLIHFATEQGQQYPMVRRLFRAQFHDGIDVSDHEALADLAAEVALDRASALEALTSSAYEERVAADIEQARDLGVRGVPFFVFEGKYAISGAQPVEAFLQALGTVWSEKAAVGS